MASGKKGRANMQIVTVNVPESYLEMIRILLNLEDGTFPSRSELIRVAVRNRLLIDMKMRENIEIVEPYDEVNFVRVPLANNEFKEYKIVRRLEYWSVLIV